MFIVFYSAVCGLIGFFGAIRRRKKKNNSVILVLRRGEERFLCLIVEKKKGLTIYFCKHLMQFVAVVPLTSSEDLQFPKEF